MLPSPPRTVVRGRPEALHDLARTAVDVGGVWHARSTLLLDAMDAAAVAELRGLQVDTTTARHLRSISVRLVDAGHAIGAFSQALRAVDRVVDRHGVTTASQIAVSRWMLTHGGDPPDPVIAEVLRQLPDGRRRSLDEFEHMSASERMAWMDAFVDTSGDQRHRAITAVLAYLADSPTIRGDDRRVFANSWWSVADAAVLLVIQDGWLRHRGLATTGDRPHGTDDPRTDPYERAVEAWADHVSAHESGELADADALRSWIRAEQAGVEFAQVAVHHTWQHDATFVAPTAAEWDAIVELAPGTHTFRLSILAGTQREFLLDIADAVIAHVVDAVFVDPRHGSPLVPGLGMVPPGVVEAVGDTIADVGGGWRDGWGLGAVTNLVGGAIRGVGGAHRSNLETTSGVVEFVVTGAAQALADDVEMLTPDLVESEIARGLVDPTIVPSTPLRRGFDALFGTDRTADGLSFAYYFPMLIEAGLLPPLPGRWVDEHGRRHSVPPPRRGRLRAG